MDFPPLRRPQGDVTLPSRMMKSCFFLYSLLVLGLPASANDAVGRLNLAGYKHREMCSATLVAPDLALTAAHCVVLPQDGYLKRIGDMTFVAGWNGESHKGASKITQTYVHPRAFENGRFQLPFDIALVVLAQALAPKPLEIGYAPGPFSMMGYPRSRPHRLDVQDACTGTSDTGTSVQILRLNCPVEPGQSGGPVLANGKISAVISAKSYDQTLAALVNDWVFEHLARHRAYSDQRN